MSAFLLSRQVGNCSSATVKIYAANLTRLQRDTQAETVENLSPVLLQRYLTGLRATMKPVSVHQHYRNLRTFLGWCVEVDSGDRPLSRDYGTHLLHKLSRRAGLPRKVGPHALRHYAATFILKQTGDLELVRQVLRHESLSMALRYAHIAKPEISRKVRRASPLDNLRAGRRTIQAIHTTASDAGLACA